MQIDVVEELGADAYLYGRITGLDNTLVNRSSHAPTGTTRRSGAVACAYNHSPRHVHFFAVDGRRLP